MAIGTIGSPPIAACRIPRIPQVGASTHEIGRVQPGRRESPTRRPVTSQTGYSRRFDSEFALRRARTSTQGRGRGARARERPQAERRQTRRGGRSEAAVEDEPAPGEGRPHRVEADRRRRDRHRQDDEDERRRHADHILERPLPALPLDQAARAEERRRPDAHHPGAERRVEERTTRPRARAEHVVGDRRVEDRQDRRVEHEEARHGQVLHVEEPAGPEEAQGVRHATSERSTLPALAR